MAAASRILRPRRFQFDGPLLVFTIVLAFVGFVMILSASAPAAQLKLSDGLYFFKKQVTWGLLGFGALAIGATLAVERLRQLSRLMILAAAVLLALTYVPGIGVEKLGASRWIHVGPMSFQPSEFAKIALAVYLADILARKPEGGWNIHDLRHALLPAGGILGLVLFQPDLGTTMCVAAIVFGMFFCAGTNPLLLGGAILGAGSLAWIKIQHTPYQLERLTAFLDPWSHAKTIGFQITQSLLAIGSGGVFGAGYGLGKQKLFYLPIQHSDFIFSVLAEEMGLIGSAGVVLLFLAFAARGLSIAARARTVYARLLAVGITVGIVFQAYLNIAVVTSSVPTTGIPLPFLSFGGTSLLVTLFGVGLLLGISRRPAVETVDPADR